MVTAVKEHFRSSETAAAYLKLVETTDLPLRLAQLSVFSSTSYLCTSPGFEGMYYEEPWLVHICIGHWLPAFPHTSEHGVFYFQKLL